jgi:hypothetical protein
MPELQASFRGGVPWSFPDLGSGETEFQREVGQVGGDPATGFAVRVTGESCQVRRPRGGCLGGAS